MSSYKRLVTIATRYIILLHGNSNMMYHYNSTEVYSGQNTYN